MFTMIPAFLLASYIEKRIVAGDHPSVWWQILAYAVLTAAEIMVSIPALEFAYTQAPKKMKSMIMAAYLAGSISFGNVVASFVVSFITSPTMKEHVSGANRPNYYLVFVGLMAVAAILYVIVSWLIPEKNFIGGNEVAATETAKGEPIGTPAPGPGNASA
jgi:POT family proton-dependent oligopeptide transporter